MIKWMTNPNLKWRDWRKEKPPKDNLVGAGMYLIWSEKFGVRVTTEHPTWWNLPSKRAGGTPGPAVRMWYRLGPTGLGDLLKAGLGKSARSDAGESNV